jgi:hypothetical protein
MAENLTKTAAQLFVPNEDRFPTPKNHSDLVKFPTRADETYKTVITNLSRHIENIKAGK